MEIISSLNLINWYTEIIVISIVNYKYNEWKRRIRKQDFLRKI